MVKSDFMKIKNDIFYGTEKVLAKYSKYCSNEAMDSEKGLTFVLYRSLFPVCRQILRTIAMVRAIVLTKLAGSDRLDSF